MNYCVNFVNIITSYIMTVKNFIVLTLAFSALSVSARGRWTIAGVNYDVDTLYHATVGPGTTETELCISSEDGGKTNKLFYTETDLSNPYVEMRAAKAGNHMRMLETVPDIARRMTKPGERYFAGVNADFFNMGEPYNSIGMCVADGFLTNYNSDGADIDPYYIVFDGNGVPTFARHINNEWFGNLYFPTGDVSAFHLNTERYEYDMLIYTPQWQFYNPYEQKMYEVGHTGTNRYGVEVKVRPVGDNVMYGNDLKLEVVEDPVSGVGNMSIPSDGYVLSAHGTSRQYLSSLSKGDVVVASIGFQADGKATSAKEVLGGFPRLLNNYSIERTPSYPEHLSNPEPRTAVGCTVDRNRLVMLVVDGRNAGGSDGVTQSELAGIMRNLGCSDAMNFDGGGSSTMYIDGIEVKNIPSSSSLDVRPEGEPRTVVNALFAVATAPVDNEVTSIEIREKRVDLSAGDSYYPVVYGYNRYGVMVSADLRGCTFHVPAEVAAVDGSTVIAGDGKYSCLLTADYNGLSYSIPLNVNGGGQFVSGINDTVADHDDREEELYLVNGVKVNFAPEGTVTVVRRGTSVEKRINR